ncbi:toprim domain-containing protein [Runella zeae]|uniref:toprim domain-containing protein n=1 Tax=Runella zeae TaxID=94255 RepID=UPI002355E351|nr:toprim domain-containing protein [Runella zeae]
MIPNESIQQLKSIPIVSYLASIGIEPVKEQNGQFLYFSPFKDEHTPSFYVNPQRNVFKDFTTSEKGGDIITLVRRMKGFSFLQAVQWLQGFEGAKASFSFSGLKALSIESTAIEVLKIKPLENKALIGYLSHKRGIPFAIASKYVQECYFKANAKNQFAVCFKNDLGGLELRNPYAKLSTNPKAITTLKGQDDSTVMLFEGFIDFLSYIVWKGDKPTCDIMVLNSVSNLNSALKKLQNYAKVLAYLDNDAAGTTTLETIITVGGRVEDCRGSFSQYKDLNQYLTSYLQAL